jgi:hypothetical protein
MAGPITTAYNLTFSNLKDQDWRPVEGTFTGMLTVTADRSLADGGEIIDVALTMTPGLNGLAWGYARDTEGGFLLMGGEPFGTAHMDRNDPRPDYSMAFRNMRTFPTLVNFEFYPDFSNPESTFRPYLLSRTVTITQVDPVAAPDAGSTFLLSLPLLACLMLARRLTRRAGRVIDVNAK